MEITRNQYFMAGLVLFLLGIQFRAIESVELKEQFAKFVAGQTGHPLAALNDAPMVSSLPGTAAARVVSPPEWIGWMLLSLGGVLVLHSMAMPKPGGG